MTRPCRPVLAALFAATLLIGLGLWARGYRVVDFWQTDRGNHGIGFGMGSAVVWGWWGPANLTPRDQRWHHITSDSGGDQTDPAEEHPYWFHYEDGYNGREVSAPMWFLTLSQAAGLWWSWRRPKSEKGFPVETVTKETA